MSGFPKTAAYQPLYGLTGTDAELAYAAKFEWVNLAGGQTAFVDPLHALNPDILVLVRTDPRERGFASGHGTGLSLLAPGWVLTQIGSTLTADIDASGRPFGHPELEVIQHQILDFLAQGS